MKSTRWSLTLIVALIGIAVVFNGLLAVGATDFPDHKIKIICPWSAGGGTDRTARKLAALAEQYLDVPLYVVNRTGGSGAVGHAAAAYAYPDGYTVGLVTLDVSMLEHMGFSRVNYKNFEPIMQYNYDPAAITVREDFEADNINELIKLAKESDEKLKVSHAGTGTAWHLAFAGFAQQVGISDDIKYLSYNGAAPAIKAVLGGEADLTPSSAVEVEPQVEAGKMKTLAIMADERLKSVMPDVPTLKEEGIDYTAGTWRGLTVPGGTPQERVEILHDAFKKVYESDEFKEFMKNQGFGVRYRGPEEFGNYMKEQYNSIGKVIEKLGIGA